MRNELAGLNSTGDNYIKNIRIYTDTSVFGGIFDEEFAERTKQFFAEIDAGRFILVTSAIVEAEIEPAPEKVRKFFARYESVAEIIQVTQKAFLLQQQYIISNNTSILAL